MTHHPHSFVSDRRAQARDELRAFLRRCSLASLRDDNRKAAAATRHHRQPVTFR